MKTNFTVELPNWLQKTLSPDRVFTSHEERMAFAIELSQSNIENNTGGPFGAIVTDKTGSLVGLGVNLVVNGGSSLLHAEIVAIMMAQAEIASFSLHKPKRPLALYSSSQPCCQCTGAIHWAGLNALYFGATADDVEELTIFKEGPLPERWRDRLIEETTIDLVEGGLLRDKARKVLASYKGPDYNADGEGN